MVEDEGKCVWSKVNVLGSGGFGSVILWKNKNTNDMIAVKECRLHNDALIGPKQRERWEMEVQIMNKLDHPNVVKAFPVPSELVSPSTTMPSLAMEYCSLGDLRKELNLPGNCCGLLEHQVRTILEDVSSAIKYLHSMRIIHRDLKPENIVLSDVNGQTVYKLIDLGYAKELDQGSLCTSFVGTVQYLAPELFLSQEYSTTVDFWSLGLLTHECITGCRPFLPNMTPAQWMPVVCKKKSDDICIYKAKSGECCYSNKMFKENYLSPVILRDLEKWLQIMLAWSPKDRGIVIKDGDKKVIAFTALDEILQKKTVDTFHVRNGALRHYVIDKDMLLSDLYAKISIDVGIPEEDLEFILPKGFPPKEALVLNNWNSSVDDGSMLFVYPKKSHRENIFDNIEQLNIENVCYMLHNRSQLVEYEEQVKMWAHAVYFCKQESLRCQRFIQSQQTLMTCLMYRNSQLSKTTSSIITDVRNLEAVFGFFRRSVENDKTAYESQSGLNAATLTKCFKVDPISKTIMMLKNQVTTLEQKVSEISTKVIQLQRGQNTRNQNSIPIENLTQRVIQLYDLLKKAKEKRNVMQNNGEMVTTLVEFLKGKCSVHKQCVSQIKIMLELKEDIQILTSHLQDRKIEIACINSTIEQRNHDRQKIIWRAIDYLVKKSSNNGVGASPMKQNNLGFSQAQAAAPSLNLAANCTETSVTSNTPLSFSYLTRSVGSSGETIREHQELLSRFRNASDSIASLSTDALDWNSLLNPDNE